MAGAVSRSCTSMLMIGSLTMSTSTQSELSEQKNCASPFKVCLTSQLKPCQHYIASALLEHSLCREGSQRLPLDKPKQCTACLLPKGVVISNAYLQGCLGLLVSLFAHCQSTCSVSGLAFGCGARGARTVAASSSPQIRARRSAPSAGGAAPASDLAVCKLQNRYPARNTPLLLLSIPHPAAPSMPGGCCRGGGP